MLDKFTDKNILILGAGTSTLDAKWENLDYDYIWTCNDFYISDRLADTKIDLVTIGYNTDIENEKCDTIYTLWVLMNPAAEYKKVSLPQVSALI